MAKLTGHDSSVAVPRASKILVSWSRSESPARNGSYTQGEMQSYSVSKSASLHGEHAIISVVKVVTRSSNSARMHPTAHISTPTPYILAPNRSSGERYHLG